MELKPIGIMPRWISTADRTAPRTTRKFRQQAVPGILDDAATVVVDFGINVSTPSKITVCVRILGTTRIFDWAASINSTAALNPRDLASSIGVVQSSIRVLRFGSAL